MRILVSNQKITKGVRHKTQDSEPRLQDVTRGLQDCMTVPTLLPGSTLSFDMTVPTLRSGSTLRFDMTARPLL